MAMQAETRPPVAIGHVTLRVTDIVRATEYFVSLGMRFIHQSDTIAVLELRGWHARRVASNRRIHPSTDKSPL